MARFKVALSETVYYEVEFEGEVEEVEDDWQSAMESANPDWRDYNVFQSASNPTMHDITGYDETGAVIYGDDK